MQEQDGWNMTPPVMGNYLKVKDGQTVQVRFIGKPIQYTEVFQDGSTANRIAAKVIYRNKETKTNEVMGYAFGWSIFKSLQELRNDESWGDLEGYDVAISRTGSGKNDTKYNVIPKPKVPLTDDERATVEQSDIDITAMFVKRELPKDDEPASGEDYDPFGEDA